MDKKEIADQSQFLATTYRDCLEEGLVETPSQFMMRMSVEPKVEPVVRPLLEAEKKRFEEIKRKGNGRIKE